MKLNKIQPGETYLRRQAVEYFLHHPDRIFNRKHPIQIVRCEGFSFSYATIDGNNRLFVAYLLGLDEVDIPIAKVIDIKGSEDDLDEIAHCIASYEEGVHSWSDLERRVVSESEYDHRIYSRMELDEEGCGDGLITLRKIYKPRLSLSKNKEVG
ncbi:MAG: hypothetical protein AABX70_02450 [Nanoarchaeota archaeon]